MNGISAADVANHCVDAWIFKFGTLDERIADINGCFISKVFQEACKIMNIAKNFKTTYHTQKMAIGAIQAHNIARTTYVCSRPPYWFEVLHVHHDLRLQFPATKVNVCCSFQARFVNPPGLSQLNRCRRRQNHKVNTSASGITGFTRPCWKRSNGWTQAKTSKRRTFISANESDEKSLPEGNICPLRPEEKREWPLTQTRTDFERIFQGF